MHSVYLAAGYILERMDHTSPRQLRSTPHHDGEEDDYKAASEATVDLDHFMPKLRTEHRLPGKLLRFIVVILVIIGLGVAAYSIGTHWSQHASAPKAKAHTGDATNGSVSTSIKQYTSVNQNLTFSYPADWKVSETNDQVIAMSPAIRLVSTTGQAVTGQITLEIRDKNVSLAEFKAGNAVAAMNSQTIAYTNPASGQRGTTYVSFLNYASSKANGIDGVYITGDTGYQTGQEAPASDLNPIDPVISLTFSRCSSSACSNAGSPLTIRASSWNNKIFSGPLLSMLKSFSISG